LHLAVRGHQLLDRPESAATKFGGDSVGAGHIRIHNSHQAYSLSLPGQLVIDAGVVASEGAHAHHGNIYQVVNQLFNSPGSRDLLRGLFQQSDLTGMVQLVLHDATEHVIKVVIVLGLARNLFRQA
jgi:hypothetical protein